MGEHIVVHGERYRPQLFDAAYELVAEVEPNDDGYAKMAEMGSMLVKHMSDEVVMALREMRSGALGADVLVIRRYCAVPDDLPPTPTSLLRGERNQRVRAVEVALLSGLELLGETFTFETLYGGRLVQDVAPMFGQEDAQTSGGSEVLLDWHVEDAFSADRCDFFGLLCLRGDASADTEYVSVSDLELTPADTQVLREPRFVVRADSAHGKKDGGVQTAVILGDGVGAEIRYDSIYLEPLDPDDSRAGGALDALTYAIGVSKRSYSLEAGDLLLLDNRRVLHSRTSFTPRFDGSDRWLLRAMVCADIPKFRLRGGRRVLTTEIV